MTFSISAISTCAGGGHLEIQGTFGGRDRTLRFHRSELAIDEDVETALIARLRSAVKEAGASTPAQIRSAIEGKTFEI